LKSEKAKKSIEAEMHEIEQKLAESQFAYNRVLVERKKYETDYFELCDSISDLKDELKVAEERVSKKRNA
jgi:hypothetical protein